MARRVRNPSGSVTACASFSDIQRVRSEDDDTHISRSALAFLHELQDRAKHTRRALHALLQDVEQVRPAHAEN